MLSKLDLSKIRNDIKKNRYDVMYDTTFNLYDNIKNDVYYKICNNIWDDIRVDVYNNISTNIYDNIYNYITNIIYNL